jgi:hypothetical protein
MLIIMNSGGYRDMNLNDEPGHIVVLKFPYISGSRKANSTRFLSPYITRRGSPMGFVFWMERDLFLFEILAL